MKSVSIIGLAAALLASCSSRTAGRDRALYLAALDGKADDVHRLIVAGAGVNAAGESGETPLHPAVDKGHVDVVRIQLWAGADTEVRNKFGDRAIDFLVEYEDSDECKRLLIEAGSIP